MTSKEFGDRIYSLRNQMGLSQLEFALLCDIQQSYLAYLELGQKNPTLNKITKIADGTELTLGELLGKEEPVAKEQEEYINKIVVYAKGVRPEKRHDLVEVIKLFVKSH